MVVTFGPFMFDTDSRELSKGGAAIALEPQPARLLALLIGRAGRVVSREELARALWPEGTHVDYAEGLHYSVRQIRLALEDSAKQPRYLETLPRRGYRFVAAVTPIEARRPATWRFTAVAAGALLAAGVMLESVPNQHHELAVRFLAALHRFLY